MQSKYLSFTVPVIHGYVYALREVWLHSFEEGHVISRRSIKKLIQNKM